MSHDARDRLILHYQATQLEYALAVHRVRAAVVNVVAGPRVVAFHFRLLAPARVGQVLRLGPDLALALGSPDCQLRRAGPVFVAELPALHASGAIRLPALLRQLALAPAGQRHQPLTAVLGLSAEDGSIVQLRLPSPEVTHVLVAGTTGSGKTVLARTLLASLVAGTPPSRLQLALVDPKARHFADFADLPHAVGPVATDAAAWTSLILRLVAEMDLRYDGDRRDPHLLLAIDELAEVLGPDADPALAPALARLAGEGREAGIHLLLCTQKPSSAAVSSLITSNLPARLVGRVVKAEDARLAAGRGGTDAEKLSGRGDFIAVVAGRVVRFQAAYTAPADLPGLASRAAAHRPPAAELPADSDTLRERVRATLRLITRSDSESGGRPAQPVPVEAVQLAQRMAAADGGRWPSAWALRQAWAGLDMDARHPGLPHHLRADKAAQAIAEARLLAEQNGTGTPPALARRG